MNEGLIPKRYAKALFKYAVEQNKAEEVYAEAKQLSDSYAANVDLAKVINNPYMVVADKEKVLLTASGAKKDSCFDKFILLVIKNNRESFMRNIALDYGKIYREANNIAQVNVTLASKLTEEKVARIIDVVKKQLQGKTIESSVAVDSSLIGGFIVKVDSMLLDASVKNELENLRLKLLSNKER